jgi:predicted RNA binding protein with dsRBD fold (UPF0201 family)
MEGARLRLTGVGEGLEVQVTTSLRGADSPSAVAQALSALFPDARPEQLPPEPSFGSAVRADWTFENVSMQTFLTQLHEQRILDTALDAMAKNLHGNQTVFSVSRLAALAGKIAFPIPGEQPLGGVFTITLTGTGLQEWLQAATWHAGRSQVPRTIQDDRAMDDDGEASTWL